MRNTDQLNGKDLVEGLVSHNEGVIRHIYGLCSTVIRHLVTSNNGNAHDAEDVLQEALLAIYQKAKEKNLKFSCSFRSYVYSVSRHIWQKELRRRKFDNMAMTASHACTDPEDEIEQQVVYNERLEMFRKFTGQLTQSSQKILGLMKSGFSVREITEIMGYKSLQYTRNRCYRSRLALLAKISAARQPGKQPQKDFPG